MLEIIMMADAHDPIRSHLPDLVRDHARDHVPDLVCDFVRGLLILHVLNLH